MFFLKKNIHSSDEFSTTPSNHNLECALKPPNRSDGISLMDKCIFWIG